MRTPILFHRWFSDGEGLAYSPASIGEVPLKAMRLMGTRPLPPEGERGCVERDGLWFVFIHINDNDPLDKKAIGRHPSLFWVASFPLKPRDEYIDEIVDALCKLIPEKRGETPLFLDVPDEWLEPETIFHKFQRLLKVLKKFLKR